MVGDFDPAEVRKVMEAEFGDWKSPAVYAMVLRNRDQLPAVDQISRRRIRRTPYPWPGSLWK